MAKPFCPGYGTALSVTLQTAPQELHFAGQTSWVRLKAAAAAQIYFTAEDAARKTNAFNLNAEVFEGPLQASGLWVAGGGALDILALIPG